MGLFRLFYKIGRMIFRDFLFKIPKKYLVVIIVFLTLFIIKNNVFAYDNYDYIPTDSPAVDCIFYEDSYIYYNRPYDLQLEQNISYNSQGIDGRYTFYFEIKPRSKTANYDLLSYPNDNFRLFYQYGSGHSGFCLNLGGTTYDLANINDFDITKDIYIQIVLTELNSVSIISQGDITRQVNLNFGSSYFNEDGTSNLILAGVGTSPYIKNVWIYTANLNSDYYVDLCNIYPCKYLDTSTGVLQYIPGSFDIVTGLFVYFDQWRYEENTLMDEPPLAIQNYVPATPTPTPTPEYIDYTSNINNVTNAINNTNNFLMDESASDSLINISSPSVANSEIAGNVDNAFNSFMTGWANLLDSTSPVSVDIYIPNYITNGGTKFITIHGDMIKNFLSTTSLIPGVNLNLLVIVQTLWTVLFAWFFYLIIISFVNGIYSGEFFNDKKLKELTSEYTGVMRNML